VNLLSVVVALLTFAAPPTTSLPVRSDSTRVAPPPAVVRIEPAVRVPAAPRSVQVMSVAVPADLVGQPDVSFTVARAGASLAGGVAVGGVTAGRITADQRRVMLTLSVPSAARAGRVRVADVQFRRTLPVAESSAEESAVAPNDDARVDLVIVPVEVEVERVFDAMLATAVPVVHAVAGQRTQVALLLTNRGNAPDTLQLALTLPDGWRGSLDADAPLVLMPGATVAHTMRLSAPRTYRPGSSVVFVDAVRASSGDSSTRRDVVARRVGLPVQVITPTRATAFGPQLGLTYSAVQLPGESVADAWGLTLVGPLSHGIDISASWTQRAMAGAPGLSRVGGGQLFPTVALRHARWRLDAGNAAADFGELGGLVRGGRGVSGTVGDSASRLSAMVAQPFLFDGVTRDAGVLAGVRVEHVHRGLRWSGTATHLRDPLLTRGALDALAVGVSRDISKATDARAEVAWRRWNAGSGLGASAELARRTASGEWRLRATSAPGGSAALARSQHDLTITGGHTMGAMRLGLVSWHADDASFDGATQQASGVGLMPQWRIGRSGSAGLDARMARTRSGDAIARQHTTSQVIGGYGAARLGALTTTTSASLTRVSRRLQFNDEAMSPSTEDQLSWTAQLMLPTAIGAVDLFSSLQHRMGRDVFAAGQHDLTLRVEQLTVPWFSERVQVSGAIGRLTSLTTGAHVTTQRVGLSAMLPFETYVRVDLERNPWLRATGPRGWTTALRMERSFGAPSLLRGGRGSGTVFEDRNGNGVRDAGERGLAGVVVRVGGEVVLTDRGGVYRLSRPGAGVPTIDETSLPFGLLLPPQGAHGVLSGGRDGAVDIPVVPTGTVEVHLELVPDSLAGASRGRDAITAVSVRAIDARGRRHVARAVVDGVARFDALPAGIYRLDVDASTSTEPLAVQGGAPTFTVGGEAAKQVVRVVLGTRRVRLFRAAPVVHSTGAQQR
jgi:hypothetical protein